MIMLVPDIECIIKGCSCQPPLGPDLRMKFFGELNFGLFFVFWGPFNDCCIFLFLACNISLSLAVLLSVLLVVLLLTFTFPFLLTMAFTHLKKV